MRVPRATYRLQVHAGFDLAAAAEIVPYLDELGVSDVYLSPIFQAAPGSEHGYDVVDPNRINEEIGGEAALDRLHRVLEEHRIGWVQDIVPNHMAFHSRNAMLMDILENGRGSPYAPFFDIDWEHAYEGLKGRLLTPFLGKFYGEALEAGEIRLGYDAGGLHVRYYDLRLPLRIETWAEVLTGDLAELEETLGASHSDLIRFAGTAHTFESLREHRDAPGWPKHVALAKQLLRDLYAENDTIRSFIDASLERYNGTPGDAASFDRLDSLLGRQHFRLAFWKVASEEINYRRFFTINDLISVRLEDDEVLDRTHALVAELCRRGVFTGLRIDHIDGLLDPTRYLRRLREIAPDRYVVVEKILERGERHPAEWAVAGTTGYDFLDRVNRLFIRKSNARAFDRLYSLFTQRRQSWESLAVEKKRLMIDKHLAGNIDNLAHLIKRISAHDRHGNDLTLHGLRQALVEVMAHFPVYRTYVSGSSFRDEDRAVIRLAVDRAREANPALAYELDFLERFLQPGSAGGERFDRESALDFVMRFQQVTGPLMAKGIEDTCHYIYNRLLSLNEVGSDPSRFGGGREEFHRFVLDRAEIAPHGLNATATHDTKRGEDARARLDVLSEIPDEWDRKIREWRKINSRRRTVRGRKVPDRNDEYFLYQTLLASWPFHDDEYAGFVDRIKRYMIKAVREAKVHTAWLKPDAAYEEGYLTFIDTILDAGRDGRFRESFDPFRKRVAWYGLFNSLGLLLCKLAAPGVPDLFQGCELWDLSMVDPDNRRPVDYAVRRKALREIARRAAEGDRPGLIASLRDDMYGGRIKLFVTHMALKHRERRADLYGKGEYIPLAAVGSRGDHLVAFARRLGDRWVAAVIPRFLTGLVEPCEFPLGERVWGDTAVRLPAGAPRGWRDLFTGDRVGGKGEGIPVARALRTFPLALLTNEGD